MKQKIEGGKKYPNAYDDNGDPIKVELSDSSEPTEESKLMSGEIYINEQMAGLKDNPLLDLLMKVAQSKGVGYSLCYEEACNTWYGTIDSPAVKENCVTKSGTLEATANKMLRWIKHL